jgi:uncharacterized protein YceK
MAAAVGSGCGTVANTAYLDPYEGGKQVYGGVQVAWDKAANPESRSTWVTAAAYADVPLSAVGDTLTLPYTVAVALGWTKPTDPHVRTADLLHESHTSGPVVEPVDGWRRTRPNGPVTYERLQGAIGP